VVSLTPGSSAASDNALLGRALQLGSPALRPLSASSSFGSASHGLSSLSSMSMSAAEQRAAAGACEIVAEERDSDSEGDVSGEDEGGGGELADLPLGRTLSDRQAVSPS
jgi:hypothetical protein